MSIRDRSGQANIDLGYDLKRLAEKFAADTGRTLTGLIKVALVHFIEYEKEKEKTFRNQEVE